MTKEGVLFEPYLDMFNQIKKEGKARFIGVSTHRNEAEVIRACAQSNVYEVVLTAVNFVKEDYVDIMKAIDEAGEAGQLAIHTIDRQLQGCDVPRVNLRQHVGRRGIRGCGKPGAHLQQIALDALDFFNEARLSLISQSHCHNAEKRAQLVQSAIGFDTRMAFCYSFAAEQTGGPLISAARIDFHADSVLAERAGAVMRTLHDTISR
jgi:hypothetical protein